jgi:hypothetical protein
MVVLSCHAWGDSKMGDVEELTPCATAPNCKKDGFIRKGEATKEVNGGLYREERAPTQ